MTVPEKDTCRENAMAILAEYAPTVRLDPNHPLALTDAITDLIVFAIMRGDDMDDLRSAIALAFRA